MFGEDRPKTRKSLAKARIKLPGLPMGMKAGAPTGAESTGNYRIFARQAEYVNIERQSIHKSYKYKLTPTPEQARLLERMLMLF